MKRTIARALHRIACWLHPLPVLKFEHHEIRAGLAAFHHLSNEGVHLCIGYAPKIAEPPKVAEPLPTLQSAFTKGLTAIDTPVAPMVEIRYAKDHQWGTPEKASAPSKPKQTPKRKPAKKPAGKRKA